MFEVNGVPVLTGIYDLLLVLRRELREKGYHYIKDIKKAGDEIRITCPYHSNGMERNPDMSINIWDKRKNGVTIKAGTCYCFACKTSVKLPDLIGYCFGKSSGWGENWIFERFASTEDGNRVELIKLPSREKEINNSEVYIDDSELVKYSFSHPYMYKRYLTDWVIDYFDIGFDKNFDPPSLTFPVRDSSGRCVFIARRSVEGKHFDIPKGIHKVLVYLYESQKLFPDATELYVCESLLNALTLIRLGKPSIALMGTGSKEQLKMLRDVPYRRLILALDNDKAGIRGKDVIYENLKNYKFIGNLKVNETGKDINDLGFCKTYEEFLNYVEVS